MPEGALLIEQIPRPSVDRAVSEKVARFLWKELYHQESEPNAKEVEWAGQFLERSHTVVAQDPESGAILASASFLPTVRERDGLIVNVATAEDRRMQGLGRKVVEAAEDLARLSGVACLEAYPLGPSVPFYEKLGYQYDNYRYVKELA